MPLISMASSSAIVKPVAERYWVFKTAASNEHTAPLQVEYAKAIGVTKIANLYVNNAYGEDGAKAIRDAAGGRGLEIVYEDTFEDDRHRHDGPDHQDQGQRRRGRARHRHPAGRRRVHQPVPRAGRAACR